MNTFIRNKLFLLMTVSDLVGLVVGDGAWRENEVYKYKVHAYYRNIEGSAVLLIHPKYDTLWIGQIQEAPEYREPTLQFFRLPWNKQFLIHLENGAIESISVDATVSNDQINQLKAIVSQFQVDIRARNLIQSEDNHSLDGNSANAFYKTMEPMFSGNCETHYDISELPKYLAEAHPNWIPLPELKRDGDFIKIEKTRNFNNCKERASYLEFDNKERSDSQSSSSSDSDESTEQSTRRLSEDTLKRFVTRIVLSGDLQNYVIQSSSTTNDDNYLEVALESVEEGSIQPMLQLESFVNVGSLVHRSNVENSVRQLRSNQYDKNLIIDRNSYRGGATCGKASGVEERWSGCWTAFPAAGTLCKSDFSAEWEDIGNECCGLFCFGKRAKCRHSFPDCIATVCYTAFKSHDSLCNDQFGGTHPYTCGTLNDCAPGFYGARCCPK